MNKRPFELTVLSLVVFGLVVWNGLRLGEAFYFWKTLEEFGGKPVYAALSGGIWLIGGLILTRGLWGGKAWARAAAFAAAAVYGSWYWFDRLVMQQPRANWLFALAATLVFLLFVLLVLFSPRTRSFFQRDSHE